MKEGGFVCVSQVGRGWHREAGAHVLMTGWRRRKGKEGERRRGFKGPAALKYLLSKEEEGGKKGPREREREREGERRSQV